MTSTNDINNVSKDASSEALNTTPNSRTDKNADANHAPASQDYTASAVFNNDKVSSQQMEGLTDVDELSREMDKNPESALNEEGVANQAKTEQNDGSAGNQKIRDAVEQQNEN